MTKSRKKSNGKRNESSLLDPIFNNLCRYNNINLLIDSSQMMQLYWEERGKGRISGGKVLNLYFL